MRRSGSSSWTFSVCAVALLAGCGGPQLPMGAPDVAPQNAMAQVGHAGSWMAPEATRLRRLLYVSDGTDNDVYVYSLPEGRLVGTLTGFDGPTGECSDRAGDVFITEIFISQISEYRHGGTRPIAVLSDPNYTPLGCSVDPTTGNLAVTNTSIGTNRFGNIAIYANAKGAPTYYKDSNFGSYYMFDSYDSAGNLFFDGYTSSSGNIVFAVLHKGSFTNLNLNKSFCCGDTPLEWDGTYLAVGVWDGATIYQFKINGSSGTEVGMTNLEGSRLLQFWIQGKTLYAPVVSNGVSMVGFYPYPAGGQPSKNLFGFVGAFGTTVSLRP